MTPPTEAALLCSLATWPERKVWIASDLTCPTCGRTVHGVSGYGDLYPMCQGKSCSTRWRAVTLCPGTTGVVLLDLFGAEMGRFLLQRLGDLPSNALLIPGPEPEYLQLALRSHEYARAGRWTMAQGLLRRLLAPQSTPHLG